MAEIGKYEDRESWIKWTREIVRRGLWPVKYITVHGPHPYPGDHHWGNATCTRDSDPDEIVEVEFQSRRPCRKYIVRNVEMWTDGPWGKETFPLLKLSELSMRARRWLRVAKRMLDNYAQERKEHFEMREGRR